MKRVKEIIKKICFFISCVCFSNFWGLGTTRASSVEPKPLWSQKLPGVISDFALSQDGKVVLAATAPDPEIEGSASRHLLSRMGAMSGKVEWRVPVKFPTREIALSTDGSLAVIADYENHLTGIDRKGHSLWSVQATCKPFLLNVTKQVLCYHEDDPEPQIGFQIFSWKGKLLFSFPVKEDILTLKVSADQKKIGLALEGGQVILFAPGEFKEIWRKKVDGEVIDLAVSSGSEPQVAVLYRSPTGEQKVSLFNSKNKEFLFSPTFRVSQIEFEAPSEKKSPSLFLYGNSQDGQYLSRVTSSPNSPGSFKEEWKKGDTFPVDYTYSISTASDSIFMGYEERLEKSRQSQVRVYDLEGTLKSSLIPPAGEGTYLYGHRVSRQSSLVLVGTDDAVLSVFQLKSFKH